MDDLNLTGAQVAGRRVQWAFFSDQLRVFGLLSLLIPIYGLFHGLLARDLASRVETVIPQAIEVPVTVRVPIEVPVERVIEQLIFVPVQVEAAGLNDEQAVRPLSDLSQGTVAPAVEPVPGRPMEVGEPSPPAAEPNSSGVAASAPRSSTEDPRGTTTGPAAPIVSRPSDSTVRQGALPAPAPESSPPLTVPGPIASEVVPGGLPETTLGAVVPASVGRPNAAIAFQPGIGPPDLVADDADATDADRPLPGLRRGPPPTGSAKPQSGTGPTTSSARPVSEGGHVRRMTPPVPSLPAAPASTRQGPQQMRQTPGPMNDPVRRPNGQGSNQGRSTNSRVSG